MGNTEVKSNAELPTGGADDAVLAILQEKRLRDYTIFVDAGSRKGDNYTGTIYRIVVTGTDADDAPTTLSLIMKCSTRLPALRQIGPHNDLFVRESYMYEQVLPTLYRLQRERGLAAGFSAVAKFYSASTVEMDEFMIFEDMMVEGFVMKDRKETLDWDHCAMVITQLAYLHAFGFVLQVDDPDKYREFSGNLIDQVWSRIKDQAIFDTQQKAMAEKALNTLVDDEDQHALERFKIFSTHMFDTMLAFMTTDPNEKYAIFTHGDCWNNNLLFKYADVASPTKPTDICFLDWQISRWASPVLDLAYFIYNCTGTTFRTERFDDLIDLYYNTLSSAISTMGCDPETLYPRRILQEHMQTYFCFGVCMAVHTIHLFTSEADEIPDMGDIKEVNEEEMAKWHFQSKNEGLYKERMSGIIRHAVSRGFI